MKNTLTNTWNKLLGSIDIMKNEEMSLSRGEEQDMTVNILCHPVANQGPVRGN